MQSQYSFSSVSDLANLFQKNLSPLHIQILLNIIARTSDATKKDFFGTVVFKKVLPRIFLKFSAKRVLYALGHIFHKVRRGRGQKPDEIGA